MEKVEIWAEFKGGRQPLGERGWQARAAEWCGEALASLIVVFGVPRSLASPGQVTVETRLGPLPNDSSTHRIVLSVAALLQFLLEAFWIHHSTPGFTLPTVTRRRASSTPGAKGDPRSQRSLRTCSAPPISPIASALLPPVAFPAATSILPSSQLTHPWRQFLRDWNGITAPCTRVRIRR